MIPLKLSDFSEFFESLWNYPCFPWQQRLAQQVYESGWPSYIDLPTASGKTACLDVAVFTLALQASLEPQQRTLGRRIFFVVNRRVIVDEAQERARELVTKINNAPKDSILYEVAQALLHISGDKEAPPLDAAVLRGGIVRDNRWARSATQPTIITSTIDQVGSRLLFRGYGVSDAAKPLHAALIAQDSLLLLDEAHISQPFVQTLNAFKRYRGNQWADEPVNTPFNFVQMTATPGNTDEVPFALGDDDKEFLKARHGRPKEVRLYESEKAKGKNALDILSKELAEQALGLVTDECCNIAVVVNRIATARLVAQTLTEKLAQKSTNADVLLVIGRMRPIDRDQLTKDIQKRVGKAPDTDNMANPMFVVATQCLEVGADFDFDAMVTECASLDALQQRFGRLNRRGRDIDAKGVIVIRADQTGNSDDPIYGQALGATWNWLQEKSNDTKLDFSVNSINELLKDVDMLSLLAPRADAPVMFPAYVDAWAQTSPIPLPNPDVSLFLHGPERGEPDVQVCWRDDLAQENINDWLQIVSLCPPSSPECMPVPIRLVRKWLLNQETGDMESSDMLGTRAADEPIDTKAPIHAAVLWRGTEKSIMVGSPADLRPGDTLVLSASDESWESFGHIPEGAPKDVAETAQQLSKGRGVLRLYPNRIAQQKDAVYIAQLLEWLNNSDVDLCKKEIRELLCRAADTIRPTDTPLEQMMRLLGNEKYGLEYERYPNGRGVVLRTLRAINEDPIVPAMDEGDDSVSRTSRTTPVSLSDHLQHVKETLTNMLQQLPLKNWENELRKAAAMHDWGKADERFQAMLINGDLNDAWAQPTLWAKSGKMPNTATSRRDARRRSGLPEGFRHEMLSAQLAEIALNKCNDNADVKYKDLVIYLVGVHHGYGRPFAPVVMDNNPPDVDLNPIKQSLYFAAENRTSLPPHRLDSGVAERFWTLTRRFGWWGLAYLEAVLRLSDQRASQVESDGEEDTRDTNPTQKEAVI